MPFDISRSVIAACRIFDPFSISTDHKERDSFRSPKRRFLANRVVYGQTARRRRAIEKTPTISAKGRIHVGLLMVEMFEGREFFRSDTLGRGRWYERLCLRLSAD